MAVALSYGWDVRTTQYSMGYNTVGRPRRCPLSRPCITLSGEGPSSTWRRPGGEILGTGKRRVEGLEGKGGPSTGRRIWMGTRKAPVRKRHGIDVRSTLNGGIVPD